MKTHGVFIILIGVVSAAFACYSIFTFSDLSALLGGASQVKPELWWWCAFFLTLGATAMLLGIAIFRGSYRAARCWLAVAWVAFLAVAASSVMDLASGASPVSIVQALPFLGIAASASFFPRHDSIRTT